MNSYERLCAHLEGRPVDRLPFMPITMMFAADFAGVKYGAYARDHRVLVDAQIKVAERFDFDYVSAISDPAREAHDCGGAIVFFEDQPPAIDESRALLADKRKLLGLKVPDPYKGRMYDRVQAIGLFRERVGGEKFIEGWIEGPCAEAADLRGINTIMLDFYDDPGFVKDLFEFVVAMELAFARAQIEAGADIIGIGDAAASNIGPKFYEELVWPYEKRMVDGIHDMGCRVRLHICGNTRRLFGAMGRLGCEIVDLDYPAPLDEARRAMGPSQILLGNIHPNEIVRLGTPAEVEAAARECHRAAGPRYILGAGCEVPRDTPHENMDALRAYAASHLPGSP